MKKNLAILYGGISPEHEVSVITAVQLMKQVDREKYSLIPIYIDKAGAWWSCPELESIETYQQSDLTQPLNLQSLAQPNKITSFTAGNKATNGHDFAGLSIDVALLCFHGAYGEAGNVQGLLEIAGIPYQGPGVTSAAIAFDKIITRQILQAESIDQTPFLWFTAFEWQKQQAEILARIKQLGYPVFVKPANGGSTIGIQKVNDDSSITAVVEAITQYDQRIIVEREVTGCIEVNVSVLGLEGESRASVPEQPLKQDEFLSFADKYERGGKKSGMANASRRIPAPISASLTTKLQTLAQRIFHIFDCSGVVRIDFFVNPSTEEVMVTELNAIPGSMSYYLWEASGVSYPQLIDRLVDIAEKRASQKSKLITTFANNILQKAKI